MPVSYPSFFENDATLHLWLESPKDPTVAAARDEVVRVLRAEGWRVQICPKTKKDFPSIAKDRHHARCGDLQAYIQLCGRSVEIKFYQDLQHENPNGGRYDFGRREKMPYLIGLQYEKTVRIVAKRIEEIFGGSVRLRRDQILTGMEFITAHRDESIVFHGRHFYDEAQCQSYNCESADGARLQDGCRVWFIGEGRPCAGRWMTGIAYRNINNMWWVLMPGGVVTNEACHRLHANKPADLKGRHFSPAYRIKRLDRLKGNAARDERFEDAARYRDALARIRATSAGAKA